MPHPTPRRTPLLVVLVAVPTLLAGCSGPGGDGGGPLAASASSTTAPPDTPAPPSTDPAPDPPTAAAAVVTTTARASAPATAKAAGPAVTSASAGPELAGDPKGLASQIAAAQAAIADPATPQDELRRMAHLQQAAFRRLVAQPEWKPEVLADLPAPLRRLTEANVAAGAKLRALITKPKETLPAWRIVAPAPAEELLGYYRDAEATTGVGWQYLAAIHLVETRMGRIRGTSTAGAQGPMQFMPATWAAYGEGDINSNRDSIAAAARYLRRNGAPGDMRKALWNYNHDYRYVDAVTLYAQQMEAGPRAYHGYHQWQVYYLTTYGDVWLPEGWESPGQ